MHNNIPLQDLLRRLARFSRRRRHLLNAALAYQLGVLSGQFKAFEVTVGVDGSTEGRGSVLFRIFVDGKEKANSGLITGFSKPKTLRVDGLEAAQRLILQVTDAEDGNRDDLADGVDGKLYLRER